VPTVTATPSSDEDERKLQMFSNKQREFYRHLNNMRWNDFEEREKIFEKTISDAPNIELPTSTKEILMKSNAQDWGEHILQAVKTGHLSRMKSSDIIARENIWFDKTSLAEPIGRFPTLCITSDDIDESGDFLSINTGTDDTIELKIIDVKDQSSGLSNQPLYIYKSNENYVIEPYSVDSLPAKRVTCEDKPEEDDFESVLRTLSVAASVTAVAQIEPHINNESFPDLFKELGLHWKQVDTDEEIFNTYLVGTKKRGKERIESFLSKDKTERTVSDYFELLGYPIKTAKYYCSNEWCETKYDRYSAEEFALYLWLDGSIDEDEMGYLLYAPYRPAPNKKEIKYAIQLAYQFQEGLKILYNEAPSEEDYDKLIDYYEEHNKKNSLLRDKPVIEVHNWLVDCEQPITQNEMNTE